MKTERDSMTATIANERRRRPRYRCSAAITIRPIERAAISGISVEISESGMSAIANGPLEVGETVELEPVAGDKVRGVVRYKLGSLYGFEFINPSEKQVRQIAENCKKLDVCRGKFGQ